MTTDYKIAQAEVDYSTCYIVSWCEHNHYDDSDFYTTYFNPATLKFSTVETGSTRYAGSDNGYQFRKDWTTELVQAFYDVCERHTSIIIDRNNYLKQSIKHLDRLSIGETLILQKKCLPRKLVTIKPTKDAVTTKLVAIQGDAVTLVRIDYTYNRLLVTIDGTVGFWINDGTLYVRRPYGTLTRSDFSADPVQVFKNDHRFDRWYVPELTSC